MFSWLCSGRCLEFFEAEDGRLSMTRLLCFLSFWPSSYAVVMAALKGDAEGVLGWYIGGYVLGYVGGKGADAFVTRAQLRNPPPDRVTVTSREETVDVRSK